MGALDVSDIERCPKPEWFREEVGFTFLDSDGDLCVYLGEGGFRSAEVLGDLQLYGQFGHALYELQFQPAGELISYRYKNEWFIRYLVSEGENVLDGAKPIGDDNEE